MKKGSNKALIGFLVIFFILLIITVIVVVVNKNKKLTCSDGTKVKKGEKCPDGTPPIVTGDDKKGSGGTSGSGSGTTSGTGGGTTGGGSFWSNVFNIPTTTTQTTGVCANMSNLDTAVVLKKGDKRPEVCYIQQLLKVTSDGVFGSQTESAMYAKLKKKQATMLQVRDCVIDGKC